MAGGIYAAVSGATVQQQRMEQVANNLANVSTSGYKSSTLAFKEVLAQVEGAATRGDSSFVQVAGRKLDLSQGALRPTGNTLDLALEGSGFFAVRDSNGQELYTRGGAFYLRQDGTVTDGSGRAVLNSSQQPLQIANLKGVVTVGSDGTVSTREGQAGKLRLVEFAQLNQLQRQGDNLFSAPANAGPRSATQTNVRQGFLESSNVNTVRAVIEMIDASRAYESLNQIIANFNRIDGLAAGNVGQTR
jgi:flagellar basal-body rod protein FlgF